MAVVGGTLEMNHPAEKKDIKKKKTQNKRGLRRETWGTPHLKWIGNRKEVLAKAAKDVLSEKKEPLTVEDLYTAIGKNIED